MKPPLTLLAAVLLVSSCASQKFAKRGAGAGGASGDVDGPRLSYSKGEDMPEADIREASYSAAPELRTIYFEYDQYGLSPETTDTLRANAAWLKEHSELTVLVQGHADEKGTGEYNLALGQKRAKTVREYYTRAGLPASQVGTISYGKEKPECTGDYDLCGPKNRRAVTLIAKH